MDFAIRQGDVMVVTAGHMSGQIPNAKPEPLDGGRVVLAHGEVTGHAHAVLDPDTQIIVDEQERRFLRMMNAVDIVHDEHTAKHWPAERCNTGEVVRQCEYVPGTVRNVAD